MNLASQITILAGDDEWLDWALIAAMPILLLMAVVAWLDSFLG